MRTLRSIAAAIAVSACTALLFTGQPATAANAPDATAGRYGCVPPGGTGLYLSKEGEAKLTYAPEFLAELEKAGIQAESVAPNTVVDGGTAVHIPIGESYDNIELPSGRVCYPGGMTFRNANTGATYTVDDFWIKFAAVGDSKVFTTPLINGQPRPAGELNLANFTVAQALTTGQFVPHNGGIGPKRVAFSIDEEFATDLNSALGTDIEPDSPWATLDIAWKGVPSRALPNLDNPELAGLKRVSDAIRAGSSLPTPPLLPPSPFGMAG
ncbi:hypothetical protein [Streptomyces boluensis]|uniref:Secreted protein n=1 Tax=Streptomyces boluensis TaxID=1775135 RepID=A0A964XNY2_9ACTN|nr:hypothetical protein [Streptomyces boluensis]NBE55975.1 hypothetical protein [Streptomyces boluensis]